jgi:hypothetical protein
MLSTLVKRQQGGKRVIIASRGNFIELCVVRGGQALVQDIILKMRGGGKGGGTVGAGKPADPAQDHITLVLMSTLLRLITEHICVFGGGQALVQDAVLKMRGGGKGSALVGAGKPADPAQDDITLVLM